MQYPHSILSILLSGILVSTVVGSDSDSDANASALVDRPPGLHFQTGLEPQQPIVLRGRDARWQLLIGESLTSGRVKDVTRDLTYAVEPENIASISPTGFVTPLQPGNATITVVSGSGEQASHPLEVTPFDVDEPVNFPNQVVPVFTKLSCNGGGCHGKAAGQNGFRLSLLGFEPKEDFEFLVNESRGRRLFPALPEKSLLLTKATAQVPHGGGRRMDEDSYEYRLLRRWISQGMPYGNENDSRVTSISVFPQQRVMDRNSTQQLMILARYSDGRIEDVTRVAQYESNDAEMASVDVQGFVQTQDLAGDVTVMARYQGQVAVFRATLPLSPNRPQLPQPRNFIDSAVFAKLDQLGISTSPRCDDSTFIRRVTLDLAGRLPSLEETNEFLADTSENKRDVVIDRLLNSQDYAEFFASKWSQILRNRRNNEAFKYGSFAFHDWLRDQIYDNRSYAEMVRDIIAASGNLTVHPPVAWYRQVTDINQQVEDTSQLFLGQRIQCARCHHHPFERWSQKDYAQISAFFSLVSKKPGPSPDEPIVFSRLGKPTAPHPKLGGALLPAGLGGPEIDVPETIDPRHRLVDWMVAPENPYFAPSLVNRYWKHFFGRGLVDPEDDMRVTNPASNPELLTALSQHFIESGYDMRDLIRQMVTSETYQLSSEANDVNLSDRRNHSRFYPKRLQAEVLLDSIDTFLGTHSAFDGMPAGSRAVGLPDTSFASYFLTVFGRPEATTACECERASDANLAQSLHLLNSKEMQSKLSDTTGFATRFAQPPPSVDPTGEAAAITDGQPTGLDAGRVEEIYLRALSRRPTSGELQKVLEYLSSKSDRRLAYEDVLWAVVNSKEFLFNH
jgi:hypothetical protein